MMNSYNLFAYYCRLLITFAINLEHTLKLFLKNISKKVYFENTHTHKTQADDKKHAKEVEIICRHCAPVTATNPASHILLDFSLTVKAATLIFISGRGSAISSSKEGKSGFVYNLAKS